MNHHVAKHRGGFARVGADVRGCEKVFAPRGVRLPEDVRSDVVACPVGLRPDGNRIPRGIDGDLHNGSTSYTDAFIMKFSAAGAKQQLTSIRGEVREANGEF